MVWHFISLMMLSAGGALLALALYALANRHFIFWPPPAPGSWQHRIFKGLFRVLVYGLVILSIRDLWLTGLPSTVRLAAAGVLIFAGFVMAFSATGYLGWRNAFGEEKGLRTTGIFARSRNPIYVATWLGLIGWALLSPSPVILIGLSLWGLLYIPAVYLEERWLEVRYGAPYAAYRQVTPRFF